MQLIYTIFMLLATVPNGFKMETIIVKGLLNLSNDDEIFGFNDSADFEKQFAIT